MYKFFLIILLLLLFIRYKKDLKSKERTCGIIDGYCWSIAKDGNYKLKFKKQINFYIN